MATEIMAVAITVDLDTTTVIFDEFYLSLSYILLKKSSLFSLFNDHIPRILTLKNQK